MRIPATHSNGASGIFDDTLHLNDEPGIEEEKLERFLVPDSSMFGCEGAVMVGEDAEVPEGKREVRETIEKKAGKRKAVQKKVNKETKDERSHEKSMQTRDLDSERRPEKLLHPNEAFKFSPRSKVNKGAKGSKQPPREEGDTVTERGNQAKNSGALNSVVGAK